MSGSSIPCHMAWTTVYISPNGDVRHCCATNLSRLGSLKENTLEEIWNGPLYQKVRHHIARGEFDQAFCSPTCEGLRRGTGYPWNPLEPGSPELENNQRTAEQCFTRGETYASHLPLHLCVEFSDACNFRCIMCLYDFIPPYNSVPPDGVAQVLKLAKFANRVALMGGEAFANKPDLKFIEQYVPPEGGRMGFITNASRLDDKMVDALRKFKRIDMTISIDGCEKEVFEKVRRRGRFEVVDANIRRMSAKARELAPLGYVWNITLAYVVMRSNLHDLPNAVRYAGTLGLPIQFGPIKGFHLFDENIFIYQGPLDETGDWSAHMDAARAALAATPASYAHRDSVAGYLRLIQEYLEQPKMRLPVVVREALRLVIKSDKDVGHLVGLYYDWRYEGVSLVSTVDYALLKLWRRLKRRFTSPSQKAAPPKAPLASGLAEPDPALASQPAPAQR